MAGLRNIQGDFETGQLIDYVKRLVNFGQRGKDDGYTFDRIQFSSGPFSATICREKCRILINVLDYGFHEAPKDEVPEGLLEVVKARMKFHLKTLDETGKPGPWLVDTSIGDIKITIDTEKVDAPIEIFFQYGRRDGSKPLPRFWWPVFITGALTPLNLGLAAGPTEVIAPLSHQAVKVESASLPGVYLAWTINNNLREFVAFVFSQIIHTIDLKACQEFAEPGQRGKCEAKPAKPFPAGGFIRDALLVVGGITLAGFLTYKLLTRD